MFPINQETKDFDSRMIEQFDQLVADQSFLGISKKLCQRYFVPEMLPAILQRMVQDFWIKRHIKAGIPICPPEGDAGTGMTATNSVGKRTGNVSAGTSVFAMIVLEKNCPKFIQKSIWLLHLTAVLSLWLTPTTVLPI